MKHRVDIFRLILLLLYACLTSVSHCAHASGVPEVRGDTVFVHYQTTADSPRIHTYIIGGVNSFTRNQTQPCDCENFINNLPTTAIYTNMLYDALLVPNIGIKFAIADRLTVGADWMYAWWNDSRHHYYRIYGGDLDVKWRIGALRPNNPFAGHHIGLYASLTYFDLQRGIDYKGVMSAKYNYAAGISYTYSLPIARHFNIDFSIGLGYMWGKIKRHTPIDDHDVWLSTERRSWLGPTRAGISLVWVFGKDIYNIKKGGSR